MHPERRARRVSTAGFLKKHQTMVLTLLVVLVPFSLVLAVSLAFGQAATEAPAGFDNVTNGFSAQSDFDLDKAEFD